MESAKTTIGLVQVLSKGFICVEFPYVVIIFLLSWTLSLHDANAQELVNAAGLSHGAFCSSMPQYTPNKNFFEPCTGAIDGKLTTKNRWSFEGDPVGSWFQVTFDKVYPVSRARFQPLYYNYQRTFRSVMIEFDSNDTSTGLFNGLDHINVTFSQYETGWFWEQFDFSPRNARRVRMTVLSKYEHSSPKEENGLIELELLYNNQTVLTTETKTKGVTEKTSAPTLHISVYKSQPTQPQKSSPPENETFTAQTPESVLFQDSNHGPVFKLAVAFTTIATIGMLIFLAGFIFLLIAHKGSRSVELSAWNVKA